MIYMPQTQLEEYSVFSVTEWCLILVVSCLLVITLIVLVMAIPYMMILRLRIRSKTRVDIRNEMRGKFKHSRVGKIPAKAVYMGIDLAKKGNKMVGLEKTITK